MSREQAGPLTASKLFKSATFWTFLRGGAAAAAVWILFTAWGRWDIPGVDVADPLMYTNAGNLVFWVVWMMALVVLAPVAGRAWCGVCPLGTLNELAARWGFSRPFPRILRNSYLKAAALVGTVLLLGLGRIHHYPAATAYYAAAWAILAVAMGAVFAGRSLCSYVCPVGGVLALYARAAPTVMAVRATETCVTCTGRECVRGSEHWLHMALGRLRSALRIRRHPCPVNLKVWEMEGAERCLLCFNCMRACPLDNVKLALRSPFSSVWNERYPRLSDTVLAAAVMGFLLLSFSRFWPALQDVLALPVSALAGVTGAALARPLYLFWVGFALPLVILVTPSLFVGWGRSLHRQPVNDPGEGGQKGRRVFPVRLWLARQSAGGGERGGEDDEERLVNGNDSVLGLATVLMPSVVPVLLGGHLALAAVKLNAKVAYIGLAAADPTGIRTYMAIEELGILPRPGLLLPLAALRPLSAFLVAGGTALSLLAILKIARREAVPVLPYLVQGVVIGACFAGGLIHWLF